MANIRIYELARDLNMTNKTLLEKIRNMDIPVKSHTSTLNNEEEARVRQNILGSKTKEIEETRVKSTIIRRRRKRVVKEPEKIEPDLTDETVSEKISDSVDVGVKTRKKPKPEIVKDEKEIPSQKSEKEAVDEKAAPEEKSISEEKVPERPDITEPGAEIVVPGKDKVKAVKSVKSVIAKPEKPPKRKKIKKRKEASAKIIKLPVKPPPAKETPIEKKPRVVKPEEKEVIKPVKEKAVPVSRPSSKKLRVQDKKKRLKKTDKIETDKIVKDKKFFKKKISFRKKEVVEGKDLYAKGRRGRKGRKAFGAKSSMAGKKTQITTPKAIKRRIKIDDTILLSDLAKRMGVKAGEMIKKLMDLGVMVTVNQVIEFDTAVIVAAEFDYELEKASFEEGTILKIAEDDPEKYIERPPVVTIMGHVDHGKTSLLDVIRKTRVTASEAGGITQHIGAYNVTTEKGQIVFLDTPGHEAFTEMRARGAMVTDLVVLVVAADDGVMPQTIEAINHAKAADVPIIVAINKIDKANAEPERVQRELAEAGLVPEEWGGDTIYIRVSAKENTGIDDLLEMILLQTEMLELKADPERLASGYVVEAKLDSGRGPVATVLVKQGTLKLHEPVVCGVHYGKVRALLNDRGINVTSAGPSMPVEIIGLSGVPKAGDELIVLADEKNAKQVSLHRMQKQRSKELARTSRLSLEKLYEKMQQNEIKDLNLIIKADVHGSIEALRDSLTKLSNDEVKINVVHSATGSLTESDISLAAVSDAIIIGFNVRPSSKIQSLANDENVDIRFYNVIYNVIKDIKGAIVGMMASTFEERILGKAEVREVFHVPKVGAVAGCYVTEGKIERGQLVRVLRDWVVCYDGKLGSLRRFKDDAKEVNSGYECGISIENFNDIKVNDIIECYYLEEIKPEIEE